MHIYEVLLIQHLPDLKCTLWYITINSVLLIVLNFIICTVIDIYVNFINIKQKHKQ